MSLIIKFFAFILVLGLAGMFVLKDPNGQAFLSVDDFIPDTSKITASVEKILPEQVVGGGSEKTMVYRWQDANGNWQFSDQPPSDVIAEQVLIDTHLNSDIAPPTPKTKAPVSEQRSGNAVWIGDSDSTPSIGTTVSPDKIEKLVDDAKNVQQLIDNRDQQLQDALH